MKLSSERRSLASVLYLLLAISILAFGFDLFHMLFHLMKDPVLLQIEGVGAKLLLKIFFFLVPVGIFSVRKKWLAWMVVSMLLLPVPLAVAGSETCRHARQLLDQSGTARDARENLLGQIKKDPPYGSFPSEIDRVSWWGKFKPFEFWENPEFEAAWINPQGQEVARQKFRGSQCALAKTSLPAENRPRGQLEGGMWNVIVTCKDYLIDKQTFAVLPSAPPSRSGPDSSHKSQESAMIWAKDTVGKN